MENLVADNLKILVQDGAEAVMQWQGTSTAREPAAIINPYVDKIVPLLKNKPVRVDFTQLQYMNSSTVTPIIRLIRLFDSEGIKTTVIYDKNSKWQQASFKALETLARMLDNIDVLGQ